MVVLCCLTLIRYPPGEACNSTQLLMPLCQINRSALKLKGIQLPPPPTSTPPPALPSDEFKAATRIIYFPFFSFFLTLYMVEKVRINAP